KLQEGIFKGDTINTPSMLAVADYLDALDWVRAIGGVKETIARSNANLDVLKKFVAANEWIEFLAKTPETLSNTSVCFIVQATPDQVKTMVKLLDKEGVAYDIGAYRDAPPGLRIWCGATVDAADIEALLPWLTWAYKEATAA